MPVGTELLVPDTFNGAKVRLSTTDSNGGLYIQVIRPDGKGCYWLHNSANKIKIGTVVKTGDVIALSGNSGHSTGPHVHFGVQKKATVWDSHEDPMPYITLDSNAMKIGDNALISDSTNTRTSPSTSGKVTGVAQEGSVGTVKDGPRVAEGYEWWDIYFKDGGGWMANVGGNRFSVTTKAQTVLDPTPIIPPSPVDPCDSIKKENEELRGALAASQGQVLALGNTVNDLTLVNNQLTADREFLVQLSSDIKRAISEYAE